MNFGHPGSGSAVGPRVVPLKGPTGPPSSDWRERIVSCRRYGPAEEAAFRIDFADRLAGLPERRGRVAGLLTQGQGTGKVVRRLGVAPGP